MTIRKKIGSILLLFVTGLLTLSLLSIALFLTYKLIRDSTPFTFWQPAVIKSASAAPTDVMTNNIVVDHGNNKYKNEKQVSQSNVSATVEFKDKVKAELLAELRGDLKNENQPDKKEDKTHESVANAMTAIGTAVAVIALILTIGTYFFELKQREISRLVHEEELRAKEHRDYKLLISELAKAKIFAMRYVFETTEIPDTRMAITSEICFYMELLLSGKSETRYQAFDKLIDYLYTEEGYLSNSLIGIRDFMQSCCRYHENHPDNNTSALHVHNIANGAWTNIFDAVQIKAYKENA